MWGRRFLQRLVLGSRPGLTTQLQNPQMGETSGWRRVFGASLWLGDLSIRFTDGNTEAQGHPVMNVSGAHWMQTPPPGSPPLPLTPMLLGGPEVGTLASTSKMGNAPREVLATPVSRHRVLGGLGGLCGLCARKGRSPPKTPPFRPPWLWPPPRERLPSAPLGPG